MYRLILFVLLLGIVSGCARTIPEDSISQNTGDVSSDGTQTKVVVVSDDTSDNDTVSDNKEQLFLSEGLQTDTSKHIIDLSDILDGGPGKDGIPSIDYPLFVSLQDSSNGYLSQESLGMLVIQGDEKRWYPYNILNRHEIVNDTFVVDGQERHLAVTFCPLCGSAIVFDRVVDGVVLSFGVSGKLYDSNLLMYDRKTESFRSQTLGQAVVGYYAGTELTIVDSDVITWGELQEHHPEAEVLSTDTGTPRNYRRGSPYGSYDTNEQLYFPVANLEDARLPLKEMLYVANVGDDMSVAFILSGLREQGSAEIAVDGEVYTAHYEDAEYGIVGPEGEDVPGFFEMWFSWANKHSDSSYVWIE